MKTLASISLLFTVFLCLPVFGSDPECFPSCHPDYDEWVTVGMPDSWCYLRQCRGDADGLNQGPPMLSYAVYTNDLNILVNYWKIKEPPFGPGMFPDGLAADFDHRIAGSEYSGYYRISPKDLNILGEYWAIREPPGGPGIPADCNDCSLSPVIVGPELELRVDTGSGYMDTDTVGVCVGQPVNIGVINMTTDKLKWYDCYVIMTNGLENSSWTGVSGVNEDLGVAGVPGWTYYGTTPFPSQDAWFGEISLPYNDPAADPEDVSAYVEYVHETYDGPSEITLFNEFYEPVDMLTIYPQEICLFAPNGGEVYEANEICTINWTAHTAITGITIEYSVNNGADWTVIQASTPNDGSYDWPAPYVNSTQCLVRVSDAASPETNDSSDAAFTIFIPDTLTLTSPNGGEELVSGNAHEITWDTSGTIANVAIDYSLDLGDTWTSLTASTINDGNYLWDPIPMAFSQDCLIYITDTISTVDDLSDGPFTIFECLIGPIPGDLNNDCYVNLPDVAIMSQHWLLCGNPFDPLCSDAFDVDGDGYNDVNYGGDDCDDNDPNVNPGALEICNGIDDDCDGTADNVDLDGDGYVDIYCGGYDCNDLDPNTYPGAPEVCDGKDNDCDGTPDNKDADDDGYIDAACGGDDCDDGNADVNPGMSEICGNGLDDDCDGTADNKDADGDDHIDVACGGDDCNDDDNTVYPGAPELCDGLDNDCDSVLPDTEIDNDGDGYVECTIDIGGWDGDTGVIGGDDCDDTDDTVYPGAPELCDGLDNDCDSVIPDTEIDNDEDGYVECTIDVGGWNGDPGVIGGDDCDDADPTVYPGAPELCDGLDNDCDSVIPDTEIDNDEDGYVECTIDVGGWDGDPLVIGGDDCDDTDPTVYPGAEELCDGIDNDCDSLLTDAEIDDDGDGYVECTIDVGGWDGDPLVIGGDDCDDLDPNVFPGAPEDCNNLIDDDCDGLIDGDDPDCQICSCNPDFNGDEIVDPTDLSLMIACLSSGSCPIEMDLNCDGVVDNFDLVEMTWILEVCIGPPTYTGTVSEGIVCCESYIAP